MEVNLGVDGVSDLHFATFARAAVDSHLIGKGFIGTCSKAIHLNVLQKDDFKQSLKLTARCDFHFAGVGDSHQQSNTHNSQHDEGFGFEIWKKSFKNSVFLARQTCAFYTVLAASLSWLLLSNCGLTAKLFFWPHVSWYTCKVMSMPRRFGTIKSLLYFLWYENLNQQERLRTNSIWGLHWQQQGIWLGIIKGFDNW